MSLEWDILSSKEKKALKLCLKSRDGKISMSILDDIYSSEDPREKMKKFRKNGLVEKTDLGNKYRVVIDKIPKEEWPEDVEV
jgi:predicted transcriptional regulator